MIDIEKRLRRTFSSMAGNETLTDALGEDAAADMLKWGEMTAESMVRKTSEMDDDTAEEFLSPYLKALRLMMRAMGQWASESDGDARLKLWARIEEQGRVLFGVQFAMASMNDPANQIIADTPGQQALGQLILFIEKQKSKGS